MRYRKDIIVILFSFLAIAVIGAGAVLIAHNQQGQVQNARRSLLAKASLLAEHIEQVQYATKSDFSLLSEGSYWSEDGKIEAKIDLTRFFQKYKYMIEEVFLRDSGATLLSLAYDSTYKKFSNTSIYSSEIPYINETFEHNGPYLGDGKVSFSLASQNGKGRVFLVADASKMIRVMSQSTFLDVGVRPFAVGPDGFMLFGDSGLEFPDESLRDRFLGLIGSGYAGSYNIRGKIEGQTSEIMISIAPVQIFGHRFGVGLAILRSKVLENSLRTNLVVAVGFSAFLGLGILLFFLVSHEQRRNLRDTTEARDRLESLLLYSQRRSESFDRLLAIIEGAQAIIRRSQGKEDVHLKVWLLDSEEGGIARYRSVMIDLEGDISAKTATDNIAEFGVEIEDDPLPLDQIEFEEIAKEEEGELEKKTEVRYLNTYRDDLLMIPLQSDKQGLILGLIHIEGMTISEAELQFSQTLSRYLAIWLDNLSYAQSLQSVVDLRTNQLVRRGRDIRSILANIGQGIFTVGADLTIQEEHSDHLSKIFGNGKLTGLKYSELLFDRAEMRDADRQLAENAVLSAIGEDSLAFFANRHHLPKELVLSVGVDRRVFEIDWDPISGTNGATEKIMIVMRDVTELRRVKAENEEQRIKLTIIGESISVKPKKMDVFLNDSRRILDSLGRILATKKPSHRLVEEVYRHLHTLKGNALSLGLTMVVDVAHKAEDLVEALRGSHCDGSLKTLQPCLRDIEFALQRYESVIHTIFPKSTQNDSFQKITSILESFRAGPRADPGEVLQAMSRIILEEGSASIRRIVAEQAASLINVTPIVGKPVPSVEFAGDDIRIAGHASSKITDILGHCFRNSLDHGIESPETRRRSNKTESGTINVAVRGGAKGYLDLEIWDDGHGIDLKHIREIARERGLVKADSRDDIIADLVFAGSLSTRSAVSAVSGRGVGLDSVRSIAGTLGGSVSVVFKDQNTGADLRSFSLHFRFPNNAIVYQESLNAGGISPIAGGKNVSDSSRR